VQAQPLPPTLAGNVAVTNKLAMAYNIAGDKQRAADNLSRSLQSSGRTAWTFNYLFKQADRSGDSRQVLEAINASHEELGYMTQLLPIEYYLAKRHKLQVYEVVSYGRCLSSLVDDLNTYNACSKFEKYASNSGTAQW
jgi:putative metalloprotease